ALSLARKLDADLVVIPELWSSGYVFSSHREVAVLAEDARTGLTARTLAAAARRDRRHYVAGVPEAARGRPSHPALLLPPPRPPRADGPQAGGGGPARPPALRGGVSRGRPRPALQQRAARRAGGRPAALPEAPPLRARAAVVLAGQSPARGHARGTRAGRAPDLLRLALPRGGARAGARGGRRDRPPVQPGVPERPGGNARPRAGEPGVHRDRESQGHRAASGRHGGVHGPKPDRGSRRRSDGPRQPHGERGGGRGLRPGARPRQAAHAPHAAVPEPTARVLSRAPRALLTAA